MEEERRATKIPRPPKLVRAPAKEKEVLQESNKTLTSSSRKRKAASPVKPPAKRAAPASAKARAGAANSAAKSAVPADAPAAEEHWEGVSEELGWGPEDCLNHKLTFKKREDMKTTKETLLQHIKRLRALGWHLLMLKDKYEMDAEAMKSTLQQEETSHAEDKHRLEAAVKALEATNNSLQGSIDAIQKELHTSREQCTKLEADLTEMAARESALLLLKGTLMADTARLQSQLTDSTAQVEFQRQQHQSAQQYSTQLQSYNTKLQSDLQAASTELRTLNEERNSRAEEAASLRGTITALEAQIETARTAVNAAEEARLQSSADCSRLRTDLTRTTSQRESAQADATALREELNRYKECTGQSVEKLEREKASKAVLESQNKAQVEYNCELQDEMAQLKAQLAMSQTTNERQASRMAEVEAKRGNLEQALQAAELKLREGELLRRKLHNTILELKGNIRVFCRVRPQSLDNLTTESVDGKEIVQFASTGELAGQALEIAVNNISSQGMANHKFAFDKVFGPAAPQHEVFEEIAQLVQSALDGYKVCIFAYGQTGSGKTYTMMGPPDVEHRGVIPRAVNQLFDACQSMKEQGWSFEMKASMMEIYNEEVKDLLGKGPPAGKKHQISHDDNGNTNVSFVDYVDCKRPEKVRDLLAKASRMRSVGATAANEQSSRSHMVFSMSISGSNESSGQQIKGMLNLIDLAGSERLSKSLATGDRLKETQAINKSLSALGDVIVSLGAKEAHIPYRNSKLTYLLQPCLGGDAKTLMFVNIAPTVDASNESLCSLRFAAKVNATEIGTARRNMGTK